jgi:Fe-S-cluster containining protein
MPSGCNTCCTGFFGITLLDAAHLRASLKKIPASLRKRILDEANRQLDILEEKRVFPRSRPVMRPGARLDALARASAGMRCPALGNNIRCLMYEHRPLVCRVFGPTARGARCCSKATVNFRKTSLKRTCRS